MGPWRQRSGRDLRFLSLSVTVLALTLAKVSLPAGGMRAGATTNVVEDPQTIRPEDRRAFEMNRRLARGVNLGLSTNEQDYELIKEAGFNHVRLMIFPFRECLNEPPYTLEPRYLNRIQWALDQCSQRGLAVVLDHHEYQAMKQQPTELHDKFMASWVQLADRFKEAPDTVCFEILNEPDLKLHPYWNDYLREALGIIRQHNSSRIVFVEPIDSANIQNLPDLDLPETDRNLIVSFHYYSPFIFTHQNAGWVKYTTWQYLGGSGTEIWRGIKWEGTQRQQEAIRQDFDQAAEWGRQHRRPLNLGEFGATGVADMESRARYAGFCCSELEARGISWSYFAFSGGFGIYDTETNNWHPLLLEAVMPHPLKRYHQSHEFPYLPEAAQQRESLKNQRYFQWPH